MCLGLDLFVRLCICACVCMYHNIICSAGSQVAVLDWYGPETDQVYILAKGVGGGVVVAELQVACEAHIQGGKVLGHPTQRKLGI